MKISIALCTYNGERFLEKQLASLAKQTRLPDEVIVCDDGSKDRTLEILETWKKNVSFNVQIFKNEKNLNCSKNFEKSLSLCSGDVVFLCDQDDVWLPEKIERMTHCLQENPTVGVVYCSAEIIDVSGERTGISRQVISQCDIARAYQYFISPITSKHLNPPGCCCAIRGSVLKQILPFHFQFPHDAYIYLTAAALAEMVTLSDVLVLYRYHENNVSLQVPLAEHLKKYRHFELYSFKYEERHYWLYHPLRENFREVIVSYPDSLYKERMLKFWDEEDVHFTNRSRIQRNFLIFWPLWILEIGTGRYFKRRQPLFALLYDAGKGLVHSINPVQFFKDLKHLAEKLQRR